MASDSNKKMKNQKGSATAGIMQKAKATANTDSAAAAEAVTKTAETAEMAEATETAEMMGTAETAGKEPEEGKSIVDPYSADADYMPALTKREKFFRFMDAFGDLVFVNICFVVSSLPLITLGASSAALYGVTLKMVRKEEGSVVKSYWKYFRRDFLPATKVWLVAVMMFVLMWFEYSGMLQITSKFAKNGLLALLILEMVLLSFTLPLVFPLLARYNNKTLNYYKNALFISFMRPGVWFRVFFSWIAPALLTLSRQKVLYYGWFVWLFILFSLLAYSNSLILRKLFDEMEEDEKAKKEEGKSAKTEIKKKRESVAEIRSREKEEKKEKQGAE